MLTLYTCSLLPPAGEGTQANAKAVHPQKLAGYGCFIARDNPQRARSFVIQCVLRKHIGLHGDRIRSIFGLVIIPVSQANSMKHSTQIKPISYLKAHAAKIAHQLAEQREPMIITQNGEAKFVLQDIVSFERTQETMALLKILALGNRQIEEGKVIPAEDAIRRLREKKALV